MANFNLASEMFFDTTNLPQNLVLVLAQIFDHVGDSATGVGRTMSNLVRSMEIGGIVFDYGFVLSPTNSESPGGQPWPCVFQSQFILASDRLQTDGTPAAIDVGWFTNTTPITIATATSNEDEDQQFPTRVHYRRSHLFDLGVQPGFDAAGDLRTGHTTYRSGGHASLRLRLRLSDEQVLAIHVPTILHRVDGLTSLTVLFFATGSLYYRARF